MGLDASHHTEGQRGSEDETMSRDTPQLHPYIALRIMQDILHNGSGSVRFAQDFPPSLNLWHDLQRKCGLTRGLSPCCKSATSILRLHWKARSAASTASRSVNSGGAEVNIVKPAATTDAHGSYCFSRRRPLTHSIFRRAVRQRHRARRRGIACGPRYIGRDGCRR